MSYNRVLPRDLFNEAKLLKCVGRLCLLIHDGMAPKGLEFFHNGDAFEVCQNEASGALYIGSVEFIYKHQTLDLQCSYNSKNNYTLYLETRDDSALVFDEQGELTPEFKALLKTIKAQ